MSEHIYLVDQEGHLIEMRRQTYKNEFDLQSLLEQHPRILAGDLVDSTNPRRWLLVSREMGIPSDNGLSDRWAVDHLFIDQDGVPAFVEVKRSTDTRIRREVVGQMLDYAANALAYWPIHRVRETFEARAGAAAEEEMERHLNSVDTPGEFWERVKTNFEAERIRLVFVSDHIPKELKTIIEFLNRQMDPTEVIGVEVPQFIDEHTQMRTIVPNLVGPTALSTIKKARVRGEPDHGEEAFWQGVGEEVKSERVLESMKSLISGWREDDLIRHVELVWRKRADVRIPKIVNRPLFSLSRNGRFAVCFEYFVDRFEDIGERQVAARIEVENELERILNVKLSDKQRRGSPSFDPEKWTPHVREILSLTRYISVKYSTDP